VPRQSDERSYPSTNAVWSEQCHSRKDATADFLRRSSLTYLECCIAVMLTHLRHEQLAAILEREAKDLRELG